MRQAQARRPDFALTDANVAAVVNFAPRLDGLPLAIELAAAARRAASRRPAGPNGYRTGVLAHRGVPETCRFVTGPCGTSRLELRVTSEDRQALFCRLAVLAGGCTLTAAGAVSAAPTESAATESGSPKNAPDIALSVLDGITALVDAHLLQTVETAPAEGGGTQAPALSPPGIAPAERRRAGMAHLFGEDEPLADHEIRFRQLETVQAFALGRLEATDEAASSTKNTPPSSCRWPETAATELFGPDQGAWLARLELEHDNLRAVLDWARTRGDVTLGLRLAGALWPFWQRYSHLTEGQRFREHFLDLDKGTVRRRRCERGSRDRVTLAGPRIRTTRSQGALGRRASPSTGNWAKPAGLPASWRNGR